MVSAKKQENIVKDRDAKSRTVKTTKIKANVKPDVEVNVRSQIMGDEGPVAKSNPHNKAA